MNEASNEMITRVRAALSTVHDPDLHQDLVTLNMIRDLEISEEKASFRLVLTTAACPVKEDLERQCHEAAMSVDGIESVDITMDAEPPQKPKVDSLPGVAHVIAISSGKGGVGKSTVSANIAAALAQTGAKVGLLDGDIYGPSMPTMMGVQRQPMVEDKKMIPIEVHGLKLISMGFLLEERQAVAWRGPMLQGAIRQLINDVHWGELDYLIIDLPPGTGDVQMSLAQMAPLRGAVVVSTPQTVALKDVVRGIAMFDKLEVPILGLIENMSHFICPSCGHEEALFGKHGCEDIAKRDGYRFLGGIPLEPAVCEAGDLGKPVVLRHPESLAAKQFRACANELVRAASIAAVNA